MAEEPAELLDADLSDAHLPAGGPVDGERSARADLALQQHLLAMIARDDPLAETLTALCHRIERRYRGAWCAVLLVDPTGTALQVAAAPTLPPELQTALEGMALDATGAAHAAAAATGQLSIREDLGNHPPANPVEARLAAGGIRSVWAVALRGGGDRVYGVVALHRRVRHMPDTAEVAAVSAAARLGALAVQRHLREQALRHAAATDQLTGLPNRASFLDAVRQAVAVHQPVAVVFLDINHFKLVNDQLGHRAGDQLLAELARRLRAVAPAPDVVARLGGDEFTILVTDATRARLSSVLAGIRATFDRPFALPGGEFQLGTSVGIATAAPDAVPDAGDLLRDADTAMYVSKANRLDHVWFDDALRRQVHARAAMESALHAGLASDQFQVGYQPIVDLRTGRRSGLEALVRWTHPDRGPVAPGEFIDLAEETGLIVPLGARVLDIALRDVAVLAAGRRAVPVAVNVSAIELSDRAFAWKVARALATHHVRADLLVLELPQSAALSQGREARRNLSELASMGVRLVVDDFASGQASVPLLRELPLAGLKVDRQLTAALATDPRMHRVVGSIADLAHALGLYVVAEGIDSAEALAAVTRLGYDQGQGFHISPVLPAARL